MRAFTITIEARSLRQVRVAAISEVAARASAGVLLRGGDRVVRVTDELMERGPETVGDAARDVLARLRAKAYFDWQGQAQAVDDWLLRAREPGMRDKANAVLALAGLRVMPDGRVAIGSAASIPTLHGWLRATPYGGSGLTALLAGLPGASRTNLTFAGTCSRAVIVPFELVVPDDVAQDDDALVPA